MPNHSLLFLHVPKTAGTTFRGILNRVYNEDQTHELYGNIPKAIADFKALPEGQRQQITCLRGHVPFGLHVHLPGNVTYVTFLRDPVERVISHYYYVRRTPEHRLHDAIVNDGVTLRGYVDLDGELRNGQSRMIAACPDTSDPDAVYEKAWNNLTSYFPVVGITERFDLSLALMVTKLNWPNVYYRKRNVSRKRPGKKE